MVLQTDTRSTPRSSRWGGSRSSYYCTHQIWQGTRSFPVEFERVTSYRGKPRYIEVCGKRRKVFNPFRVHRWKFSPYNMYHVCEFNPTYIQWVEDFGLSDFLGVLDLADPMSVYGSMWRGDMPPFGLYALDKLGSRTRNFVIRDMYEKANSPRFNAAVFLAELDETLVGIKDLLQGCAKAAFGGKAYTHFQHFLRNPEELWLWIRYALLPTMMDVEDIIAQFNSKAQNVDRVQDGSPSEESKPTGTFTRIGYGGGNYDVDFEFEADVKVSAGGAMDIFMRYDPHQWGTSSWDVLMAAYERIPFSFVFDWFLNVGAWLASLRKIEIRYAQSYATYAIEATVRVKSCDPYFKFSGADIEFRSFLMDRITNIEPPTLPLVDKRWANINRVVDSISLIVGFLKRALRRR